MNILEEIQRSLECYTLTTDDIKCLLIDVEIKDDVILKLKIPINDKEQRLKTLQQMSNLDYDDGYGSQKLFGTVWLNNGTWLERAEYDGAEWWELKKLPDIPKELQ